jgi:hypothetical protein
MPLRRHTRLASAVLALLAFTACDDDPLRPEDAAGAYVLRTVRGEPLPAVLWEGDGMQFRVLADTLHLNADGTGREIWLLELSGQRAAQSSRLERPLQFEIRDGRLEGTYLCPPSLYCLGVVQYLRGWFTSEGLRLDVAMHGEGPFEFVRADWQ